MKRNAIGSLAAALLCSAAFAAPPDDARLYSILAGNGAQIGYASHVETFGPQGREIVDEQDVGLGDEGDPWPNAPWFTAAKSVHAMSRTQRTEDADGHTLSILTSERTGPEWRGDWSRNEARIANGHADVTRTTPADSRTVRVALPPGVRFDDGAALLQAWNPTVAPRLEFDAFDADAMAVEHVIIAATGPASSDGTVPALRERYEGAQLVAVSRLTVARDGRILRAGQPMFGGSLTVAETDRATALAPHDPYQVLPHAMAKSPYRIPPSAIAGHIRYVFSFRDGVVFALPQTGEQRAVAGSGHVTLDICVDCGPGLATDPATLADALKATPWMQSDAAALKAIAEPIAQRDISDSRKMELLAKTARAILGRLDFTGHYSALETLSRRAGDCTEASVLLAALGRAAGIPTRVANGLVYSREAYHGVSNTFLPHSWTLAFVGGRWRSYDAALDDFDSTHIALAVGDGDRTSLVAANQLAGLLVWDSVAEIRASPEP
ncbi:MAG: transglutaminase-like domain-containing protein [Rhizomicrobium sp.]